MAARIIDRFIKSPRNVCYTCGSAQRIVKGQPERIIDWGIHIEFEGDLEQCETCIQDAANHLGLLTLDQSVDLQARLFQAEASRAKAEGRATKLEALIAKLTEVEDEEL